MNNQQFDINTLFAPTTQANTATYGNERAVDILAQIEGHTDRPTARAIITPDNITIDSTTGKLRIGNNGITKEGFNALTSKTISGTRAGFTDIMKLTNDPEEGAKFLQSQLKKSLNFDSNFSESKLVILNASNGKDAKIEAIHGSKYASLPNVRAMEVAQRELNFRGLKVDRWSLEGRKLRLEMLGENGVQITGTSRLNDIINHGVELWNSEDGTKRFSASAYLQMLACTNGMTRRQQQAGVNRRHIGSSFNMLNDIRGQLRQSNFEAGNSEIIDMIQNSVTQEWSPATTSTLKKSTTLTPDEIEILVNATDIKTVFDGFNHLNDYQRLGSLPVEARATAEDEALNFLINTAKAEAYL